MAIIDVDVADSYGDLAFYHALETRTFPSICTDDEQDLCEDRRDPGQSSRRLGTGLGVCLDCQRLHSCIDVDTPWIPTMISVNYTRKMGTAFGRHSATPHTPFTMRGRVMGSTATGVTLLCNFVGSTDGPRSKPTFAGLAQSCAEALWFLS
jgi:hypothetical protein